MAGEFSGSVDAGYAASSGNSDTSSINAAIDLSYVEGLWTYIGKLGGLQQEDNGDTTAQNYMAEGKVQRALSPRSYLFGDVLYEHDDFGGVRDRSTGTLGYGYKVIDTDARKLNLELGVGARSSEFADGTEEEDAIGQLGVYFEQQITGTTRFVQDLLVESGKANTLFQSDTGLEFLIVGNLNAKIGFTVKHNSEVPAGTEKTDTYTTVGLAYAFGSAKTE